jgi:2-polyprenyl-3-methyl-5-hydroxy-6-metoxy-1,4-benzoquinol methylase
MKSIFLTTIFTKENQEHFLKTKDYFLTNESFNLNYISKYDVLITQPFPSEKALPNYYDNKDYISHTDSKTSWFDRLYQFVKRFAISKKVKLITNQTEEQTILDVGCGTGDFLLACKNKNWQVTGIEPNTKARRLAEQKLPMVSIFSDIKNIELTEKFDIITLWHVLEHIPDLDEYINRLKKFLKPNGRLIIAVPNYKSYDARYYGKFWAAYDVPRHLWHFSQKSISSLFLNYKMRVEKIIPMKFDSFYVSFLSEKYKNGKTKPFHAFYIGFRSNLKARKTTEYSSLIYILKNEKIDF